MNPAPARRLKFSGTLPHGRHRPSLLAWLILGTILVIGIFVPVIGLFALPLFLLVFLPSAIGGFIGSFAGGILQETRIMRRAMRDWLRHGQRS